MCTLYSNQHLAVTVVQCRSMLMHTESEYSKSMGILIVPLWSHASPVLFLMYPALRCPPSRAAIRGMLLCSLALTFARNLSAEYPIEHGLILCSGVSVEDHGLLNQFIEMPAYMHT